MIFFLHIPGKCIKKYEKIHGKLIDLKFKLAAALLKNNYHIYVKSKHIYTLTFKKT